MYYYSKNSSRKIIHSESCPYCKRMNPRNQKNFATRRDAIKAGYQYCRYCAPIGYSGAGKP